MDERDQKMSWSGATALADYNPNSTVGSSRLDTTRHVRRVEPMHFGCVELVEQHGSTRSSRLVSTRSTRRTCRVVSRHDVTSKVEFGLIRLQGLQTTTSAVRYRPTQCGHSVYYRRGR